MSPPFLQVSILDLGDVTKKCWGPPILACGAPLSPGAGVWLCRDGPPALWRRSLHAVGFWWGSHESHLPTKPQASNFPNSKCVAPRHLFCTSLPEGQLHACGKLLVYTHGCLQCFQVTVLVLWEGT